MEVPFFHALHTDVESVSALVRDLQGVNNIEAFSPFRIYYYGYRYQFNKESIFLGQIVLCADFINIDLASLFIQNSFGIQPDVSSNFPLSVFFHFIICIGAVDFATKLVVFVRGF